MAHNILFSSLVCCDSKSSSISMCISNDRYVYSFGKSIFGSHGHNTENFIKPTQINGLVNIKMIACGATHSMCLDLEGNVYAFGSNTNGKLGINKTRDEFRKTFIPQKLDVVPISQISCGSTFTILLSNDGMLYSFGDNKHGELALGHNNDEISPKEVPNLTDVEIIVCGGHHCICKTFNNEFYSWGLNDYGQLGQGITIESTNIPMPCDNWPDKIISIKCGLYHSLLLTEDCNVYSFGRNNYGQLGINDKYISSLNIPVLIENLPKIKRIEYGNDHSHCIDFDNNLWTFGANYYGQLGLPSESNKYKPTKNTYISPIIDISTRGNHTFIKTSNNKIYSFGNNNFQQLGRKTKKDRVFNPKQAFKGTEDMWSTNLGKSRAKSARK